jgi:2,3-bisphosphoglycerate-dependent phosphoglycerate mutase
MNPLVLLRHGQSEWNRDGRFAGWMDVRLTSAGIEQAHLAGTFMRRQGFDFDRCHTSVLQRATQTACHCLDAMRHRGIPTERHWRLNERHYGALHGLSRNAVARDFGAEQLRRWRRSYDTRPPPASAADTARFHHDPSYAAVPVPDSESQADTVKRVQPFLKQVLRPDLATGTRALVIAHGSSLRALIKLMCGISVSDVAPLEIPNGIPLIVEFTSSGRAKPPYRLYE